jgi:hypothetical protein
MEACKVFVKNIIIGFSKSKKKIGLGSRLIRSFLKKPYSHVYTKSYTKKKTPLVYHAVGGGLQFNGPLHFNSHHAVVKEVSIEVIDEIFDDYMDFCIVNEGAKYATLQNFGIFLSRAFGLRSNVFKNGDMENNCSELVFRVFLKMPWGDKVERYLVERLGSNYADLVGPDHIEEILDMFFIKKVS